MGMRFEITLALIAAAIVGSNVAPVTVARSMNPITSIQKSVEKTTNRLWTGCVDMIREFREAEDIKKLRKKYGIQSLSYSQYTILERSKEDFYKLCRLGFTCALSPQFFLLSYIAIPSFFSTGPWAWRVFPSTFDKDPEDLQRRQKIMNQRRVHAVIKAITSLEHNALEDGNDEKLSQLQSLRECFKTSSLESSLHSLHYALVSEVKKSTKLVLDLRCIPGSAIADACRSLGIDAIPNIPLIRRLNVGELNGYCEKIKSGDEFILSTGTSKLTESELFQACYDRCIPTPKRISRGELKIELDRWLSLTRPSSPSSSVGAQNKGQKPALVMNEANRRLALMGLNILRGSALANDPSSEPCIHQLALSYKAR